ELGSDSSSYVAPRSELESKLCLIFAEVLGLDLGSVGIRDDFFKMGGDSIVSIQVVSRIRQRVDLGNNVCSVKDIFTYRTIEKLYDNVVSKHLESNTTNSSSITSEQGMLSGEVTLLPIQEWFFENDFTTPSHFNQSFLVKVASTLDIDILQKAVDVLVNYHDAFRLRYDGDRQYYDDKAAALPIQTLDVSTLSEAELHEVLTLWQSSFDLTTGPLYSIGYIHGFSDKSSRIFFALHHLIVDAVSWRILTEDLRDLYSKAADPSSFGPKGTSYRQWVEAIRSYASINKEESSYWDNVTSDISGSNKILESIFTSTSVDSSSASTSYSSLSLTKTLTNKLLKESNKAYNTEINDLLLSALGLALNEVLGSLVNHITLEGHGREEEIGKQSSLHLDLSRTIGWFTTMYPVRLEVGRDVDNGTVDLASTIKYTKELLRQVPNKGIGFGSIIGYQDHLLPKVSFNYLGQLDQTAQSNNNANTWSITEEASGIQVSPNNHDRNIININGAITQNVLSFSIASKLNNDITSKLAEVLKDKLEEVVNHSSSLQRTYLTVSDVGNITTQEYLDKLQEQKEVEAVYLANSLQQGFIYHYLNQGDVDDAYLVQVIWEYQSKLDIDVLKQAWKLAQRKYPSLRLRFSWDEELLQIIDKEGVVDFRYVDLSAITDATVQEGQIKQIQEADRLERYKLEEGNLFRLHIIKQRDELYTCIFSSHHAILDGWSNPILLNFVHNAYTKLSKGEELSYIDTVEDQSYKGAQKYLQDYREENSKYWQDYINKIEEKDDLSILITSNKKGLRLNNYKQVEDHKAATLSIKDSLYDKLKTLSKEEGITLNAILQYVWHKVLKVYGSSNSNSSNNQTITTVVGTTVSGRNIPVSNIEHSVGLYINTLPLIVEHNTSEDTTTTIVDAIKKLQSDVTEINTRSNTSLAKLQKDGTRLFDTLFVFENYPVPTENKETNEEGTKQSLSIYFKQAIERLDYPLSVIAYEGNNSLTFSINYAGELFTEETIKQLLSTAKTILTQIGEVENSLSKDTKEQTLTYLSTQEQHKLLINYNNTQAPFPHNKTIQQLFEEQAERTPDNVAIIYNNIRL
ncbi:MAG: hypothetical protein KDG50_03415, partial [Chromatiales bacterium]|nr:hypothetical protein [Chromatiales bacterium]